MDVTRNSGDDGYTYLWSGEHVPKDTLRLECSGTIDELNSFLGDALHYVTSETVIPLIGSLQRDLCTVAGYFTTSQGHTYPETITEQMVEQLVQWISDFEIEVSLTGFVLPGSTPGSAKLDICRCVCRRAERRAVSLSHQENVEKLVLQYLNRLSYLLFMMARYEEAAVGAVRYT